MTAAGAAHVDTGRTTWGPPPAPFARPAAPTVVLGLGNPILGDDAVGWRVAEAVAGALGAGHGLVEVDCVALGGLALMERLVGYHRAVLVDAVVTGHHPPGTVLCFPLEALPDPGAGHTTSAHDTSLAHALALGRSLGAPLPATVTVVAVEARDVLDFSDTLSPAVAAAVPRAVTRVIEALGTPQEENDHGIA